MQTFKGFDGLHNFIIFHEKIVLPPTHLDTSKSQKKSASHTEQVAKKNVHPFLSVRKNSTKSTSTELDMALGLEHADLAFCMVVVAGLATSLGASAVFFHSCVARLVFFGRLMNGFCFVFEGCLDPTGRSWYSSKWLGTKYIGMGYSFAELQVTNHLLSS